MSGSSKLSLKLLIDQTANKVVFAEAGKDTIDFLFNILTLPVGTIVRLLSKKGMVGSIANLYESVENLKLDYLQPNQNKDILLKPNTSAQGIPNLFLLTTTTSSKPKKSKAYVCSARISYSHGYLTTDFHYYVTENPHTLCPSCGSVMNREMKSVGDDTREEVETETAVEGASTGGYVKGIVTYMLMDDLSVKPMSTISSITLLKKLNFTDIQTVEERVVEINIDKGLKLLKTAFQSKEVLTSVFLLQEKVPKVILKKKRRVSK